MKTINIPCRFAGEADPQCGLVCGQIEVADNDPRNSINDFSGYGDSRCPYHENLYGKFTELLNDFVTKTGQTPEDFFALEAEHEFKKELVDEKITQINEK